MVCKGINLNFIIFYSIPAWLGATFVVNILVNNGLDTSFTGDTLDSRDNELIFSSPGIGFFLFFVAGPLKKGNIPLRFTGQDQRYQTPS